jgi:hypothetical protein
MREHTTTWQCSSKAHKPFVTSTRDAYLRHLDSAHPGKFSAAQQGILAVRNARTDAVLFKSCPLCGIKETSKGSLLDHVVGHLRALAIQSLPTYDTAAGDEEDFDSDEQRSGSERSRSTIRHHTDDRRSSGVVDQEPEDSKSNQQPDTNAPAKSEKFRTTGARKHTIRMDPDCAICHGPATGACDCEVKDLELAVRQAEARMMQSLYNDVSGWVKSHSQDQILEHFNRRVAVLQGSHSSGGSLVPSQRDISKAWEDTVVLYPQVLEYYYGLVNFTLPDENEHSVKDPILPLNRRISRRGPPAKQPDSEKR